MHVCIIGTGASGWMCCNLLKDIYFIEKITVIGSPDIPSIGVGESNTLTFVLDFLSILISQGDFTLDEFIRETDATVKYGVRYIDWSKNDFIHHFKNETEEIRHYGRLLANKNEETYIHDLFDQHLTSVIFQDNVSLDENSHPISYHFDAGKFIDFFSKNALKNPKVNFISGTVDDVKKGDRITSIFVDGQEYLADYYVFATGDSKVNSDLLGIEYEDLSNVLLTNKAVVYPLKYTDKRKQFHPYTKAKTMKNGWRWITPTWSRIGTGYVFSDNHISIDEAIDEFLTDIGDKTLEPFVVDFSPKYNKTSFRENYCTIGMAQGFLEPLDAPGITITIKVIENIIDYLASKDLHDNSIQLERINEKITSYYEYWCSFILCQYKTCHRNDTDFWKDHKLVKYDYYDIIMNNLDDLYFSTVHELMMFHQTIASKDIRWKTTLKGKPYKLLNEEYPVMHHLDFIQKRREEPQPQLELD
jgi:tryptophan halogenase